MDVAQIINPDGVTNQIEGGAIQGVSFALKERVTFDRKKMTSRDWIDHPILTFPEVPTVETVLLDRSHDSSLGVGEGSVGPTVAAVANAFAHATGKRCRDLPMIPDRVKALFA